MADKIPEQLAIGSWASSTPTPLPRSLWVRQAESPRFGGARSPLSPWPHRHLGLNHSLRKERKERAQETRTPSRKTSGRKSWRPQCHRGSCFSLSYQWQRPGKQYPCLNITSGADRKPPELGCVMSWPTGWPGVLPQPRVLTWPASAPRLPAC